VSVLNPFAKILEKVINNRLIDFLESNQQLSKNQFGFRRYRNCEGALYWIVNCISEALDESQHTAGTFCDLSRAFECVDHDLMVHTFQQLVELMEML
jgi:hypothetical protein